MWSSASPIGSSSRPHSAGLRSQRCWDRGSAARRLSPGNSPRPGTRPSSIPRLGAGRPPARQPGAGPGRPRGARRAGRDPAPAAIVQRPARPGGSTRDAGALPDPGQRVAALGARRVGIAGGSGGVRRADGIRPSARPARRHAADSGCAAGCRDRTWPRRTKTAWRGATASFARFLERDVPQLGIRIPAAAMRRFWTMLAHWHGQTWNAFRAGPGARGVRQDRARLPGPADRHLHGPPTPALVRECREAPSEGAQGLPARYGSAARAARHPRRDGAARSTRASVRPGRGSRSSRFCVRCAAATPGSGARTGVASWT